MPTPLVTVVGSTIIGPNFPTIDLPAGTAAGDLLVLVMGSGGLAGDMPTCGDPRMSFVQQYPSTAGDAHRLVAYGFADASGDPLSISMNDLENAGGSSLVAYRLAPDSTIASAVSVGKTSAADPASYPCSPVLADGDQCILAVGVITFAPVVPDGWTQDALQSSATVNLINFHSATPSPGTFASSDGDWWLALSLGITPPVPPPPYDTVNGVDIEWDDTTVDVIADDIDDLLSEVLVLDDAPSPAFGDVLVEAEPWTPTTLARWHLDGGSVAEPRTRTIDGGTAAPMTPTITIDGGAP